MDSQLRVAIYVPAFYSVPVIHSSGDGVSGEASSSEGGHCLGGSVYA